MAFADLCDRTVDASFSSSGGGGAEVMDDWEPWLAPEGVR